MEGIIANLTGAQGKLPQVAMETEQANSFVAARCLREVHCLKIVACSRHSPEQRIVDCAATQTKCHQSRAPQNALFQPLPIPHSAETKARETCGKACALSRAAAASAEQHTQAL